MATIVAGAPVRGSWWAHPKSHAIFRAARALGSDPDVLAIPFVAGKVTFIHRPLWPAVLAVASERASWQTRRLSPGGRTVLNHVEAAGEIEASAPAVRELERRLLAVSREVHTDRGRHGKIVETWTRWAAREGVAPIADAAEGRAILERAAASLGPRVTLPWDSAKPGV